MIRLTCTSCKAGLEMDEAFAGGVCRCQHCGTIQTVPAHLKDSAGAGTYPQPAGSTKNLYQGRAGGSSAGAGAPPNSGLDELGDAVASSGLSSSGLQHPRHDPRAGGYAPAGQGQGQAPARADAGRDRDKKRMLYLMIGGGAVVLALIVVVIVLLSRGGGTTPEGGRSNSTGKSGTGGTGGAGGGAGVSGRSSWASG